MPSCSPRCFASTSDGRELHPFGRGGEWARVGRGGDRRPHAEGFEAGIMLDAVASQTFDTPPDDVAALVAFIKPQG